MRRFLLVAARPLPAGAQAQDAVATWRVVNQRRACQTLNEDGRNGVVPNGSMPYARLRDEQQQTELLAYLRYCTRAPDARTIGSQNCRSSAMKDAKRAGV